MASDVKVALITGPDPAVVRGIVRVLVEERLIACGNLVEGATSIYRWQGAVEEAAECLGILKTTAERVPAIERRLAELHPYDVPEFLVLPVESGSPDYLAWVRESTASP